jgi:hypothetical protein
VLENHCQVRGHRIFDPSTASGTRAIRSSPTGSAPRSRPPPWHGPARRAPRTPRGSARVWHDGDPCFTSGPGTCKARNLASNPSLHDLSQASRHGSDPRRRGGASHRASDLAAGGQHLPRHQLPGRGSGGRVHRALQRAGRRPAAVASLPVHLPHRLRFEHHRAGRRDTLAVQPMTTPSPATTGPGRSHGGDTHPPPAGDPPEPRLPRRSGRVAHRQPPGSATAVPR